MNYSSLISLLIKLMNLCGDDNNNNNSSLHSCHEKILAQMQAIAAHLIEMLIDRFASNPSWNAPGIDASLVHLAQICMILEYNERSPNGYKRLIDSLQHKYRVDLLDGTAKFLQNLIKKKPEVVCQRRLIRIRMQAFSYFGGILYEICNNEAFLSDALKCASQTLAKVR